MATVRVVRFLQSARPEPEVGKQLPGRIPGAVINHMTETRAERPESRQDPRAGWLDSGCPERIRTSDTNHPAAGSTISRPTQARLPPSLRRPHPPCSWPLRVPGWASRPPPGQPTDSAGSSRVRRASSKIAHVATIGSVSCRHPAHTGAGRVVHTENLSTPELGHTARRSERISGARAVMTSTGTPNPSERTRWPWTGEVSYRPCS